LETLIACNLCGSADEETYASKRGASTGRVFRIVRCRRCGLVYVNPRLTKAENQELYGEAYFNGRGFDAAINYVEIEQDDGARAGERAGIIEKIRALKPGLESRVLDVGCGTGGLLRALVDAGYANVKGVEFSEYAGALARAGGLPVVVGDVLDGVLGDEQFDVINATEVIEHLRDPMAFFRHLKGMLRPGGVFIYSTGNTSSAYARSTGAQWPYLNPEGHLFYYSPETLERYFRAVGLQPVHLEGMDRHLRRRLVRADERIAHSQLVYFGKGAPGLKGRVFRAAAALPEVVTRRALVEFHGRLRLPLAMQGA